VLGPGERAHLRTRFSLAVHTTRVPRPGHHAVDIIVNGRVAARRKDTPRANVTLEAAAEASALAAGNPARRSSV
jgi:hypothetical protein